MRFHGCVAAVLLLAVSLVAGDRISIKINSVAESSNSNTWNTYSPTTTQTTTTSDVPSTSSYGIAPPQTPVIFRQPVEITLPAAQESLEETGSWMASWHALDGRCFKTSTHEYVYELCPFRNVTQKSITGPLHVVLGLWGSWVPSEGYPFSQLYTDGNVCSSGRRRQTEVRVMCAASHSPTDATPPALPLPTIADISEPRTCVYALDFMLPLACPGAVPSHTATSLAPRSSSSSVSSSSSSAALGECQTELTTTQALMVELQDCIAWLLADPTTQDPSASSPCSTRVLVAAGVTNDTPDDSLALDHDAT